MKQKLPISFTWLNATQFCGALNDNLFKFFLILFLIASKGDMAASDITSLAGAIFVLPFLLFSATAGVLADKISKSRIVTWAKILEIVAMVLACLAFLAGSEVMLFGVLFLMATQSAFFGPSKYGIIPELVGRERLSKANGYIQAFTFIAIIFGTVLAPILAPASTDRYALAGLFCVLVAVTGTLASLPIERTAPAGTGKEFSVDFVREIWRTLYRIRKDRYLLLAVIAAAYFLLLGAFMQINGIPYGIQELGMSSRGSTLLFLFGALGIAAGSLLAGRLSGRNVELGVVPVGAIGLFLSSVALWMTDSSIPTAATWIFVMGLSSGLFIVPIEAFIQFSSPPGQRGEILAASSFLSWVGVLLASILLFVFTNVFHMSPREGFLFMGLLTLALTVVTVLILPDFLIRFFAITIMRLCYRLRTIGIENIPVEGGALLVCNHVSWVDALLLLATQQRRIRFIMFRRIYETPWLKPLFKLMQVIPIAYDDSPRKMVESLTQAKEAIAEGYLVCIFAEGSITRSGMMYEFKSGFEHIVKGTDFPIIPIYLGGAWGSIFSYANGKPLSHLPLSFPYKVTILFGKPMPVGSTAVEVRQAVMELSCDYFNDLKPSRRPLPEYFVKCARQNWHRQALADTTGKQLTFGEALIGSILLADELNRETAGQGKVGVLLPATVGGALTNMAISMLDKVPVNLNFTASNDAFASAIRQSNIQTMITSRAFMERFDSLPMPDHVVYIENIFLNITDTKRRNAWLKARFLPSRLLTMSAGFDPDRIATIIFSSGSTGEPKGVMLSHHNIMSNIEASRMVFQPSHDDCICAVLPFFHSFGFTATLWFPLLSGIRTFYNPNPIDASKVAEIVRTAKATVLFATPTFLMTYIRRASPEDFSSLRLVVVGAEKLKKRIADLFENKFGIRPMEGYGATELSPIAALNIPDIDLHGVRQVGCREGTVGHPIPGVAIKIIDPDTGEQLPAGSPGLLMVKGPNVMLGYVDKPEKTQEVIQDGWYNTGDIAIQEKDGFITITDRLSRFSKIGGEMVPHIAIEEVLQKGLKTAEHVLAVTSVPDEKKGERLVVLCTEEAGDMDHLKEVMAQSEIPNLWKPAPSCYFRINALPMLGSGKLDLKGLKKLAVDMAGNQG